MKIEKRAKAQRSRNPKPTPRTLGSGLPSRGFHTCGCPGLPEFRGPDSWIPEGFSSASPTELSPAEAGRMKDAASCRCGDPSCATLRLSVLVPTRNQECQEGDPGRVTPCLFAHQEPPARPTRNGWIGTTPPPAANPSRECDSHPLLVDRDPGKVAKGPVHQDSVLCSLYPSGMSPTRVKSWPLH